MMAQQPQMLNAAGRNKLISGGQTTTNPGEIPTKPIGGFQLCCLWGCDDCEWVWGGGDNGFIRLQEEYIKDKRL